jgi:phosphoribosyl 1,2-cyclic phosphodiesterase
MNKTSTLTVVGSSSSGNGYIIDSGGEQLILECGLPIASYQRMSGWILDNAVGCLCSHVHADHAGYAGQFQYRGIGVYTTKECAKKLNDTKTPVKKAIPLKHGAKYKIGGFSVIPLNVPHNADCFSFVIDLPDGGPRVLFYTDCFDFPYSIKNVNYILGEVNYNAETLVDNMAKHDVTSHPENHMELRDAFHIVSRHNNPDLRQVICCHLSSGNSDEKFIKKLFHDDLGMDVLIARPGLTVELLDDDF